MAGGFGFEARPFCSTIVRELVVRKKCKQAKQHTEMILATTAGDVTSIGLDVLSVNGTLSVQFTQPMIGQRIETVYGRSKGDKVVNRTFVYGKDIPFTPNGALYAFDCVLAIDTNTKLIDGEHVSVTAVSLGRRVWCIDDCGQADIGYFTQNIQFCIEFTQAIKDVEQLGWLEGIALFQNRNRNRFKRIGVIVDSDLRNLQAYNDRTALLLYKYSLPPDVFLLYASADTGKTNCANWLISITDKAASQVLLMLERKSIPKNTKVATSRMYKAKRIIENSASRNM